MDVYIEGKRVRLDPSQAVGKGGEADVFLLPGDVVAKIFKAPDHADFTGNPIDQEGARQRIAEHQHKLKAFPQNLPARVVKPIDLVTDKAGAHILGYTMGFVAGTEVMLRYSERSFRGSHVDNNHVVEIFTDLHETVQGVHKAGVVVGDFNDLNILVKKKQAYVIDADSMQFGKFLCRVFTERFVDPTLCDSKVPRPVLSRPHNEASDWYAFNVMLMKSLLYCDPYGGVYKPANPARMIPHTARPLRRITVFHKDVKYPKPAVPFEMLSDEILHHFQQVFEKDERCEFPIRLLKSFRWTKCDDCGTEHGRPTCPTCKRPSPAAVVDVTQVRGKVVSKRVFKTSGEIIHAACHGGDLKWVYKDGGKVYRETGVQLPDTAERPQRRWRILGNRTMYAYNEGFVNRETDRDHAGFTLFVDRFNTLPVFDTNESKTFWVYQGVLYRDGEFGQERIGDVLQGQTLFWVGPKFGFGFYRAGEMSVAFVFNADKGGLNDSVKMPRITGHIVDATCYFAGDLCWFLYSTREAGKAINRCILVKQNGEVAAQTQAEEGDGSWLSTIRGKCAAGAYLFSVTDDGLVRAEQRGVDIIKTSEFPDTEPFVHAGCHLFAGKGGLFVVDRSEIRILRIN